MAPLVVLLVVFAIAWLVLRRRGGAFLAARIALAAMLVLTGAAHFTDTDELAAMVPPFVPAPALVVYATGLAELALAVLLVVLDAPVLGWVLALFFVALLPANIYSAVEGVGLGARGVDYLWFRVPLQALFIAWSLVATRALGPGRRR